LADFVLRCLQETCILICKPFCNNGNLDPRCIACIVNCVLTAVPGEPVPDL